MKPDYTIGFEKDADMCPYAHVQNENLELEVEPEEISLRSFRVRDYLENHIWDEDGMLNLRVRRALMDISDDFWRSCNVRWVKPKTVLITGSICNFNWSEYSDVDVHLVIDFKEVHENEGFVQEYFDEKKNEWNDTHDKLNVYGFPVEMYVENVDADTVSGGVYDLWENEWVKKPKSGGIQPIKLNKYGIKQVAADIMTEIDDLCDAFKEEKDMHRIEKIGEDADRLFKKIKAIRGVGLRKGEMGSGNIVYKVLKRNKYLDKLWQLSDDVYDKVNSVNESKSFNDRVSVMF